MSISATNTMHESAAARVLVGVDGSEQSKLALRWAAQLAEAFGARLDVVAAWQYPVGLAWSALPPDWDLGLDTEKMLAETVDEVFGAQRPIEMQLSARQGNAAQVLMQEAAQALMLVVGSRGHGGFTGLLLGSVSAVVAEHAPCPVVVLHGQHSPPILVHPAAP